MDYKRLSDEELVEAFLKQRFAREPIRDELFARYYERFDGRIRAVLYTYGLPYSPGEAYYNEVFVEIYRQVFELAELEAILGKYDSGKGGFANWFLNYVVVSRVRDWLRRLDSSGAQKNIDRLREGVKREREQLSLNEPLNKAGEGLPLAELIPAEETEAGNGWPQAMASAISRLPPAQRLMLRLLFVAYEELPEEEIEYLATLRDVPAGVIREMLAETGRELRSSDKYEQGERLELALACLARQVEYLRRELAEVEAEIRALFPERRLPEEELSAVQLKEIAQARDELARAYRAGEMDEREYRWQALVLERKYIAKHLAKAKRKKEQLVREYRSGRYFIFPSYKQLAKILGLAEGTVASRISRMMGRLRKLLEEERILLESS